VPNVDFHTHSTFSDGSLEPERLAVWLASRGARYAALTDHDTIAGCARFRAALTRQFEAKLILTALDATRGRRIEAAQRLGIGRNTITRKIQELGLDD